MKFKIEEQKRTEEEKNKFLTQLIPRNKTNHETLETVLIKPHFIERSIRKVSTIIKREYSLAPFSETRGISSKASEKGRGDPLVES